MNARRALHDPLVFDSIVPLRAQPDEVGEVMAREIALVAPVARVIGKKTRVTDVYMVDSAVETMTSPGLNHLLYLP